MRPPLLLALLACALLPQLADAALTLHVAPTGRDAADGTAAAPFATLEQARDAIRRIAKAGGLPDGGVIVEIAPGAYERAKPFQLEQGDSGTTTRPVVYRARAGAGPVRIVGGRVIDKFAPVTDPATLARLDPAARANVLRADLKALGVTDLGQLTQRGFGHPVRPAHMELFFNDRPMTLARWPNDGTYATMAALPDGQMSKTFTFAGDRPARWATEPDGWVFGYWYHDWADSYQKIASIDAANHSLTMAAQPSYGLRKGNRWCALNLLCELDAPGEFYIDRDAGALYFWPPEPLAAGRAVVSIAETLIELRNVSHVIFRGLTLECCRGTALKATGGTGVQVVGCTIRNAGNNGASLTGTEHAVIGCDVTDTDSGISVAGGDRKTLTPAKNLVENNHVQRFSRWCRTYRPAISVSGCGNIIRHNLLHDGPHNAIQLGGNDHLVELNEIHSVCYDTGDVGAFYSGRDWTARGTVIRHNHFHDVRGPGIYGAMGVYLDDQASGFTIQGNVFARVTRAAFVGGGCDNIIENNVFLDCAPAVHIDARGLGWQKKATDDPKGELRTRLAAMPYQNDLWRQRYPQLPNILNDDPGTPKRNIVRRNVAVGGKWDNIEAKAKLFQVVENNLVTPESPFVDVATLDLRPRPNSPLAALNFDPIPTARIGLYQDDRRATWPVTHAVRPMPAEKKGK